MGKMLRVTQKIAHIFNIWTVKLYQFFFCSNAKFTQYDRRDSFALFDGSLDFEWQTGEEQELF